MQDPEWGLQLYWLCTQKATGGAQPNKRRVANFKKYFLLGTIRLASLVGMHGGLLQ
jgi:hypothetical protein